MAIRLITILIGVFGLTYAMHINNDNKPINRRELEKFLGRYQHQADSYERRAPGRSDYGSWNELAQEVPAVADYVEILKLCDKVVDNLGLLDSIRDSQLVPADRYSQEKLSLEVCRVAIALYQIINNEGDNPLSNGLNYLAERTDKRSFDSVAAGPLTLGKRTFDSVGEGPMALGRKRR